MHSIRPVLVCGALAVSLLGACSTEHTTVRRETETVAPAKPRVVEETTTVRPAPPAEETTTIHKKHVETYEEE